MTLPNVCLDVHTFMKWGYFEVGAYIGTPGERERVLNDFMLGRLDVGKSNLLSQHSFLTTVLLSSQSLRHSTLRGSPSRFLTVFPGLSLSWTRRIV